VRTGPMVFKALTAAVPFYERLTLEALGGHGVRWPATEAAAAMPAGGLPGASAGLGGVSATRHDVGAHDVASTDGALRVGHYRSIWASPEVEVSPALHFTIAEQVIELSPQDAQRLGIGNGDTIAVAQNGTRLTAHAAIRTGVLPGTAFLADGIPSDSANALTEPVVEVSKP
jgi:NADH-quinone oxidoreductase subunit G